MAIVAVSGDACTTTTVALTAAWPVDGDVILVEADPSGGDLAAWLDLPVAPSLSTVVTRVLDGSWPEIERLTRLTDSGLRLIPAPARAAEAAQAIGESVRAMVPTLATLPSPVAIADTGRIAASPANHPYVGAAAVTVVVHRQARQSARAAAVRLQRLADHLGSLAGSPTAPVVAVVGSDPFDLGEVSAFVGDSVGSIPVVGLPVDELSASVFAGRTGVSTRRLARLPLPRAASDLAAVVRQALEPAATGLPGAAR